MGIKDNFSQAVKELWKKDGGDKNDNKPTELEQYLRQSDEEKPSVPVGVEVNKEGIPLETPYYRKAPEQAAPAAPKEEVPAQQAPAGAPASAQARQEEPAPPVNRNVQNAQNAQNARSAEGAAAEPVSRQPQSNAGAVPPQQPNERFTPNDRFSQNPRGAQNAQNAQDFPRGAGGFESRGGYNDGYGGQNNFGGYGGQGNYNDYGGQGGYGGGAPRGGMPAPSQNENDEITIISKNTQITGNIQSLANMQIDGDVKGDVATTRNIDMSGKVIGDVTCNNAGMTSAAMQGNISLKGRMRMDRDTILIGDLSSQYADINGRIRGKLDIVGKAELKRDAVVFGDINASTIAVTDGAIIQGYVNTTFLSKEDSRNIFPDAIAIESKEVKS